MKFFVLLIAAVVSSPYYLGQGYKGPNIGRVKNLTEITGTVNFDSY